MVRRRCDGEALRGQLGADVSELLHRTKLDLADSLTGDVELGSDFLKGSGSAIVQSESEANHVSLSRGESSEDSVNLFTSDQ